MSGRLRIKLRPDSSASCIYNQEEIEEGFFCNYELNPAFHAAIEAGGLQIVGIGGHGEARIVELAKHPFYIATLFLPQLASSEEKPHPLITAYLKAVQELGQATERQNGN